MKTAAVAASDPQIAFDGPGQAEFGNSRFLYEQFPAVAAQGSCCRTWWISHAAGAAACYEMLETSLLWHSCIAQTLIRVDQSVARVEGRCSRGSGSGCRHPNWADNGGWVNMGLIALTCATAGKHPGWRSGCWRGGPEVRGQQWIHCRAAGLEIKGA